MSANVNQRRSKAARKSKSRTPWARQAHCATNKARAMYQALNPTPKAPE